jgi:hypothetical protein
MVLDAEVDPPHHPAIRARHQHRAIRVAGNLPHPRQHRRRLRRVSKLRTQSSRGLGIRSLYGSNVHCLHRLRFQSSGLLIGRHELLFPQITKKWFMPYEEDVPK